jgi:hypothetical protein
MNQDLIHQCMRIVASWELEGVKASKRTYSDRIVACTPTTAECVAIVSLLNISASDDEDSMDDSTFEREIENPICILIDRCAENTLCDPDTYSQPLLNCCTDIFTKGVLDTIREMESDIRAAMWEALYIPEVVFLNQSLDPDDDISGKWSHPLDRTTAWVCYTLSSTSNDRIRDQLLWKIRKILILRGHHS